MNLPEDLYREITESITIVGGDEAHPGDRRSPRVKLSTQVSLFPWSSPTDARSVRIRDLSIGGIGILHSERLPLDSQVVVSLPRGAGRAPALLLYTVVYWEPLAENLVTIGAQFERTVTESELEAQQQNNDAPAAEGLLARITHAFARRIAS